MNTSENLPFGELLQQLRKRKRLKQKELAEQIGVSRETISLWERGAFKPETTTTVYELATTRCGTGNHPSVFTIGINIIVYNMSRHLFK